MSLLRLAVLLTLVTPAPQELARTQVQEDFSALVGHVTEHYAYLDRKVTDWPRVRERYAPELEKVRTRRDLLVVLEQVVDELYDHHAHLTSNTAESQRLIPAGADIWAAWRGGRAVVEEVRAGSDAERAGIRAGATVVAIAGTPVETAIAGRIGRGVNRPDDEARSWALRALLAGRRAKPRTITVAERQATRTIHLPAGEQTFPKEDLLTFWVLPDNVGNIRIQDAHGNQRLIGSFDAALAALRETSGLVVDLRETPSGGNTTIARGILGRFVASEEAYQKHDLPSEMRATGIARSWLELVRPRGPFRYDRKVVVLVSHWTGSMGEGLALGFDATGAVVVGTPMARLLGATYSFELPNSKLRVNLPTERLFHVNGTPREAFVPGVVVHPPTRKDDPYPWMLKAREVLRRLM